MVWTDWARSNKRIIASTIILHRDPSQRKHTVRLLPFRNAAQLDSPLRLLPFTLKQTHNRPEKTMESFFLFCFFFCFIWMGNFRLVARDPFSFTLAYFGRFGYKLQIKLILFSSRRKNVRAASRRCFIRVSVCLSHGNFSSFCLINHKKRIAKTFGLNVSVHIPTAYKSMCFVSACTSCMRREHVHCERRERENEHKKSISRWTESEIL